MLKALCVLKASSITGTHYGFSFQAAPQAECLIACRQTVCIPTPQCDTVLSNRRVQRIKCNQGNPSCLDHVGAKHPSLLEHPLYAVVRDTFRGRTGSSRPDTRTALLSLGRVPTAGLWRTSGSWNSWCLGCSRGHGRWSGRCAWHTNIDKVIWPESAAAYNESVCFERTVKKKNNLPVLTARFHW